MRRALPARLRAYAASGICLPPDVLAVIAKQLELREADRPRVVEWRKVESVRIGWDRKVYVRVENV